MGQKLETATFRGDDDSRLVSASLACRACLSSEVDWALEVAEWDPRVQCRCRDCGHARTVSLTGEQALRLAIVVDRSHGEDRALAAHGGARCDRRAPVGAGRVL